MNLVTNAVQSMAPGGKLYLSSRSGKNNGSVVMTVMDTGKGIAPEYLPHIFDPFFRPRAKAGPVWDFR